MAIDDAVVDTIKARLMMMNKTLDVWSFFFNYNYERIIKWKTATRIWIPKQKMSKFNTTSFTLRPSFAVHSFTNISNTVSLSGIFDKT